MTRACGFAAKSLLFCFALSATAILAPPVSAPSSAPATQTSSSAHSATTRTAIDIAVDGHTELTAAIQALVREYSQHLRNINSTVRTSSSYFQDQPAPDISEDAIASQLRVRLASDSRVDGYVKWQLLSGIGSPAKDSVVPELLAAYRSSPNPAPLPGIDAASRQAFERERALIIRETDIDNLDKDINNRQDAMIKSNQSIIDYRNELFAKLPPTYDVLTAGLQDVNVRLNAGADMESIESSLAEGITKWMNDPKTTQSQKMVLASAIERLSDEKIPCIQGAQWDGRRRQAKFQEKNLTLSARNGNSSGKNKLADLVPDLRNGQSKN